MDGKPPPPPAPAPAPAPNPSSAPPRVSRLRRLLVRVSASERLAVVPGDGKERGEKEEKPAAGAGEAEVGSVGLDRMVLSFMEESAAVVERPPRGRCNCFNGSNYEESDDEEDFFLPSGLASPRRGRRNPGGSQGSGAERERGGAEPSRGRVPDRGEVRQDLQGQGRVPPRGGRRPQGARLRRRRLQVALGEDPLLPSRGARVHRRGGGGRGEADRGGGFQVRVRFGALDEGVPRGAPGATAAVRGHAGPPRADRGRRGGGGAAEPEEEGAALSAVAQAGVHARQVAVPARPHRRQDRRPIPHHVVCESDASVGGELLRRVRAPVRHEPERGSRHRRREDHGGGVAVAPDGGGEQPAQGEGRHGSRRRPLNRGEVDK